MKILKMAYNNFLFLLLACFISLSAQAKSNTFNSQIKPFKTDGCSYFIDGNHFDLNSVLEWRHCCIVHDIDYWIGGVELGKKIADSKLSQCVDNSVNSSKFKIVSLGEIVYIGVTVGGRPKFLMLKSPASFRWGYGIIPNQLFYPLSNQQMASARSELFKFEKFLQQKNSEQLLQLTTYQRDYVHKYVMDKLRFTDSK